MPPIKINNLKEEKTGFPSGERNPSFAIHFPSLLLLEDCVSLSMWFKKKKKSFGFPLRGSISIYIELAFWVIYQLRCVRFSESARSIHCQHILCVKTGISKITCWSSDGMPFLFIYFPSCNAPVSDVRNEMGDTSHIYSNWGQDLFFLNVKNERRNTSTDPTDIKRNQQNTMNNFLPNLTALMR